MKRPVRSVFLTAALGFALALSSCTGPGDDPAPETSTSTSPTPSTTSSSAGPTPDDDVASAELTTFYGSWQDVQYAFDHPADWTVGETFGGTEPGRGTVVVKDPEGNRMASLDIVVAWGASCSSEGCEDYPAVYLGDWAGLAPLSVSGFFVARSMAVDLSDFPQERETNDWYNNVQVVTSLTSTLGQPPSSLVPAFMYGVGQVETGVEAVDGSTQRTVLFRSNQEFGTLQEAKSYAGTDKHRLVQAMIASFREQ